MILVRFQVGVLLFKYMIALLYKILIGSFHIHKWVTEDSYPTTVKYENPNMSLEFQTRILRCEKCGNYKRVDLGRDRDMD